MTYIKKYFDMIEDLPIAIHLKTLNNWDQRFGVIYQPERKYDYSKLGEFLPLLMNFICMMNFLPLIIYRGVRFK